MKTFFRFTLCLLLGAGVFSTARAQSLSRVNQYGVTPFHTTWTDISVTGDKFYYNKVDQGWGTITMPFDFPYDDSLIPAGSTIRIGASGVISLSSDTTPDAYALGNPAHPGLVCIFSALIVAGTGHAMPDDSDYYEVDGASPNRVLTIQYHFAHMPGTGSGGGGGGAGGTAIMMQVKFYETSGMIEFIYLEHNSPLELDLPGIDTINFGGAGLNGFSKPSFVSTIYETHLIASPDTDLRWTPGTAGVTNEKAPNGFALGIFYPNPANNTAQIPLTLPEQSTLRVEVRDASGALMKTNSLGTLSAGDHTITLDTKDLPSGTYLCTITCGNVQITRQMTIIR